ncbi:MAG: hypothetical protein RSB14_04645 [Kiritimatiellia bacterium]
MLPQFHNNNTLSLAQHGFALFLSLILSAVIHFTLLYFCGSLSIETTSSTTEKTHITPENLPPIRIEALVSHTLLSETIAPAEARPNVATEAVRAAETVQIHAEQTVVPAPTLPLASTTPPVVVTDRAPRISTALPIPNWMTRQEIVTIPETPFTKRTNPDPRWVIDASAPRMPEAPDLASTVDLSQEVALSVLPPQGSDLVLFGAETARPSTAVDSLSTAARSALPLPNQGALPTASDAQKTPPLRYQSIDERLSLALTTYESPSDRSNLYFRLSILRKPESALPILPKDVIFIQDISGSIGSRRLAACKKAMQSALFNTLRAGDRFNIFAFRDVTLTPVQGWLSFNPETRLQADTFIQSLRARGNTDLFLLLQDLRTLPTDPNRLLIAIVITDGEPTVGVTETTRIIGEFSRMNGGTIAIYSFGTKKRDPYFLDMLCYANRGENSASHGSIADLPQELAPVFESIRNPVLKNPSILFDTASGGEVHPKLLTHLYADRPLSLYGRVPKATQTVTCQLRGNSTDAPYDALFTFSLNAANVTTQDLRKAWAQRAMFDLLSDYATNPSQQLLQQIETFSRTYNVPNPYQP